MIIPHTGILLRNLVRRNPVMTGRSRHEVRDNRQHRASEATLLGVVIVCAVLPYANTLLNGFVYDDLTQVVNNPYIQSPHHLREIFFTTVWSYVGHSGASNYYRPMMTLGYLILYQFWGPVAYYFHLTNLVFHAAVVSILFALTLRLTRDRLFAFVTAAAFGLHPIHTEAVAWVAAVTELELTFFYLLSFWLYLGNQRSLTPLRDGERFGGNKGESASQWAWVGSHAGSTFKTAGLILTFVCALLSKEQALTLPFIVTLYEHLYREDRARTTRLEKFRRYAVLWAIAAGYVVFRIHYLGAFAPAPQRAGITATQALLSAMTLLASYVAKLLWPAKLCVFYVFRESTSLLDLKVLAGILTLIASMGLFILLRRRGLSRRSSLRDACSRGEDRARLATIQSETQSQSQDLAGPVAPALNRGSLNDPAALPEGHGPAGLAHTELASFGLVWFVATLAPVLNVRWLPANAFAERYLYLPSVGFCWVVAWASTALCAYFPRHEAAEPSRRRGVMYIYVGSALILLGVLSAARIIIRNRDWRDEIVLFTSTLADQADAFQIRTDLGAAYWAKGDVNSAEREWSKALRAEPASPIILNNLGLVRTKKKHYAQAVELFKQSMKQEPDYTDAHINLGAAYEEMGLTLQAESEYKIATQLSPLNIRAHNHLGRLYLALGRLTDAEREFTESLRSTPNPGGLGGMGDVYLRRNQHEAAERAFKAAVKLGDFNGHAHFQLAKLERARGNSVEELRELEKGLEAEPGNRDALAELEKLKATHADAANAHR